MDFNSETPTIKVENVTPGMVLDFGGELVLDSSERGIYLGEAEVISVERPDGLGGYGLWVSPEDGACPELYVAAFSDARYRIAG